MSFATELLNKPYTLNTVIKVDDKWYSILQVDSDTTNIIGTGSGVPAAQVGILKTVTTSPIQVDIRNVKTTVQTLNFVLNDNAELITSHISLNSSQFLDKEVLVYSGFQTGSFDFQDYMLVSRARVKTIKRLTASYSFNCAEVISYLQAEIESTQSTLDGSITNTETSITLDNASSFPTSGMIKIEDEFITYTGKSINTLTGATRGGLSGVAAAHDDESVVYLVRDSGDINPITLMLRLMISPGGGGTYDVLPYGLGISQTLIDVTEFENIRTTNFSSDQIRAYIYNVTNGLSFIEDNILLSTNTRLFPKNGKISIGILDQVVLDASVATFDENTITGDPQWSINSDKIVNKVIVNYDFIEGTQKYARQTIVTDTDSITTFGEKVPLELNFKYVRAGLSGSSIATNRANRLLLRSSTPKASIVLDTQYDTVLTNVAENIDVTHRYVPSSGGVLGINEQVEILSKSVNVDSGRINWTLGYTSFSGLRIGLIAPTHLIATVTNQKTFTVSDASCYEAGYFLRIWDEVNKVYFADAANEIASVVGNTITMVNDFTTTLTTSVRIKFANYDESSSEQKAKYAYIVYNTNLFDDGSKGYQIIP